VCEYCGCQDVPAIAALTEEHDEIRAVARDASKAAGRADHGAAADAAQRLLTLLRPHTEIEERGLFPAMAGEFADHVTSLADDHRRMDDVLAAVASGQPQPDWADRLRQCLAELFAHILREQDGLFPAALSVLTPQQWDVLDKARSEVTSREQISVT
jgi:hemerythrin-like domain-containing protein